MTGPFLSKAERAARSQLDLIIRSLVLIHRAEPNDALIRRLRKELRSAASDADIMSADVGLLKRVDEAVLRSLGFSVPEAAVTIPTRATRPQSKPVASDSSPKIG